MWQGIMASPASAAGSRRGHSPKDADLPQGVIGAKILCLISVGSAAIGTERRHHGNGAERRGGCAWGRAGGSDD